MADRLSHLRLSRAQPVNERRRRQSRFPRWRPDDREEYARKLAQNLEAHMASPETEIAGFDPRRILKLQIEGLSSDELISIPDFSIVAEEGSNVTVLFATEDALIEFRRRLARLEAGQRATREDILFAVRRFDYIGPDDRVGPQLEREGRPAAESFIVDVELWPLELMNERLELSRHFEDLCADHGIEVADSVNNSGVILFRVRVTDRSLNELLNMRDVRQVELPPRYQFTFDLLDANVETIPEVLPPPDGAPTIAVLDSGLATAHPLIAPAVGDSQSFAGDDDPTDQIGHGTAVAGHALMGDIATTASRERFQAQVRILSGKIGDRGDDPVLLENRLEEAIQYFKDEYGCRVFNLSVGVRERPYKGGHVDRLAATIDWLSREYDVLFVVSAGNGRDLLGPENWREAYPRYLLEETFRIVDPAPSINAITVGSLANYEVARMAIRNPTDPAFQPIARHGQPSPFTLSGPGPGKSIKPDLVEFGGNYYIDTRAGRQPAIGNELGELSLNSEFASGSLYKIANGTSFAAPRVAHVATRLVGRYPDASNSLIRALLVAHAELPEASVESLDLDAADLHALVGYGRPRAEFSLFSEQNRVTMVAEDVLGPNEHHFYELPLPDDLFSAPARRLRRITVAISHAPKVRRTRLQYRESMFSFRVVKAENLEAVARAYRRLGKDEREASLPELNFSPGPNLREGGSVQCATRIMGQVDKRFRERPYFIVVTNSVPNWVAAPEQEPYALVVVIEDLSEIEVRLYEQVRLELEARARARTHA